MRSFSQTDPVTRGSRSPRAWVRATLLAGLSIFAANGYPGMTGASFGYGMGMGVAYVVGLNHEGFLHQGPASSYNDLYGWVE